MPTIPPNNTSGLYGIDGSAVPISGNIDANNIAATGNVTVGGFIVANGSITTNSNFVGDLVGNVLGNITLSGSNTQVIYNANGVTGGSNAFTFNDTTNTVAVLGAVSATGNVTGNYILGNGSQLTGLPATYSNANVATFMANFGSNTIVTTGNITGGYLFGNGSQLTGLPQQYGNANVAAYLASGTNANNIVTTGTVQGEDVTAVDLVQAARIQTTGASGNITGANYVQANYFVGDGSLLTNVAASYGNTQVSNYLASGTNTGNIITTANVSGQYILGNGAFLTGVASSYGNAEVNAHLAAFGSNVIVTTGNITGGNIIGNGQALTNLPGANVVGAVANATYATSAGTATSATTAGTVTTNAQPNITSVGTLSSLSVTGNIATSGFFIGDGSQLTGLPASYGNANVAAYLPTYTGNLAGGNLSIGNNANITNDLIVGGTIFGTFSGNISGNLVVPGANTDVLFNNSGNAGASSDFTFNNATKILDVNGNVQANYFVGDGSQLTNLPVQPGTYSNANVQAYLPTYSGNIGALGNINSSLTLNGDQIEFWSSNANVAHNGILFHTPANGSLTSFETGKVVITAPSGASSPTTLEVAGNIKLFGNGNLVFDATAGGQNGQITTVGNITGGNITTAGNISGSYIFGNGSQLTGLPATYSNADVTTLLASFGSNTISTSGNITGGNIIGNGQSLTNLPGANVIGTVANATFATSAGTATSATTAGTVTTNAQPNITSVGTLSSLSVTGNIATGGILTDGYYYANGTPVTFGGGGGTPGGANTQIQFNDGGSFAGNVNMTFDKATGNIQLANLVVSDNTTTTFLRTTQTYQPNTGTNTAPAVGRIFVGDGWNGNTETALNPGVRSGRFVVSDTANMGESFQRAVVGAFQQISNVTGNVTSVFTRFNTVNQSMIIGGGPSANTINNGILGIAIDSGVMYTGNFGGITVGNIQAGHITGTGRFLLPQGGSNIGNAFGFVSSIQPNTTAQLNTAIGFGTQMSGNTSGNVFCFYNPSTSSTYGIVNGANARAATNYYFLRNDDDVAQCKLGSVRLFNEFRNDVSISSGAITVNKNNGQVQYVNVTENITSVTFSNFVRTASDGTNTDQQTDTVTVIFRQDSTGRTITLPTGTGYRYAAGINTMGSSPNAVQMISVTGITDAAGTGIEYLITVSPEFS